MISKNLLVITNGNVIITQDNKVKYKTYKPIFTDIKVVWH
jgi:hypothetical protein